MTQAQAREAARRLTEHVHYPVVACSEDTWMGRYSGTTEWGVVLRGLGLITDTATLPDELQAALAAEED